MNGCDGESDNRYDWQAGQGTRSGSRACLTVYHHEEGYTHNRHPTPSAAILRTIGATEELAVRIRRHASKG
jgi:hypothetical protein